MLLRERLEKTGDLFFRWRSYIPFALVPLLILKGKYSYFGESHLSDTFFGLACFAISLSGSAIRIFAVGYSRAGTSGRNTRGQFAKDLNRDGIYSIVRNPIYVGNAFIVTGISMLSQNFEFVVETLFFLVLFYVPIILREEQFLLQTFDKEYLDYAKRTPALLPDFRLWQRSELKFNLIRVLHREHDTFMGLIWGFSVTGAIREAVIHKRFFLDEISKIWAFAFVVCFISWIILKRKKKYLKSIDKGS